MFPPLCHPSGIPDHNRYGKIVRNLRREQGRSQPADETPQG